MTESSDRPRILRAIKKCLSDTHAFFQEVMDTLDEIGRGTLGSGLTPLIGGYAMQDPKKNYRTALIKLDSAEKVLEPLAKRFKDGRVNQSHFSDEIAMILLKDLVEFNFNTLIQRLSSGTSKESSWYRLRELCEKIKTIFDFVAND